MVPLKQNLERNRKLKKGESMSGPKLMRGDSLHNRELNKTGCVLEIEEKGSVLVLTVEGKASWDIDECDVIIGDDDYEEDFPSSSQSMEP